MLEHLGWQEAADKITDAIESTIASKIVTYDFCSLNGWCNRSFNF